jgi:hypothetical protein
MKKIVGGLRSGKAMTTKRKRRQLRIGPETEKRAIFVES